MGRELSDWYDHSFKRRLEESYSLRKKLRITVYGSWHPAPEKDLLLEIVNFLRANGYENTDVVEGDKRPNLWEADSYTISTFYLENSDVNFLIFTHQGKRMGVTAELSHILESPRMCDRLGSCVVFNEIKKSRPAVGKMQIDRMIQLNEDIIQIQVVDYKSKEELFEAVLAHASSLLKKFGPRLDPR